MKPNIKSKLFVVLALAAVIFITGCAAEPTPYETNNADNYTVSVRYDANGGIFTTNTSSIVDSYNISELDKNSGGMAEIALLSPDDANRGNDAFAAVNNGYFLAGWYKERNEIKDSEGNSTYTYSGKWDFAEDMLEVDPAKQYSAETPVLTLYAAWVPLFEIEFYSLDSGEFIESYTFDPTTVEEISVPAWDEETGKVEMYKFPEKSGYTFANAYYDEEATQLIDTAEINHSGVVNYETGTAENPVQEVYIEWTEGEWYRIYNAEQLADNASLSGNYEIMADLDFSDAIWPTSFMYGNYGGKIIGNGHTIKNVSAVQTNNSKTNAGLFGYLTETAEISALTLDNASFTIEAGTRVAGTNYGLFAGSISNNALIDVNITNSVLQIDSGCYFGTEDYTIGLFCGMGDAESMYSDIECSAVGEDPEKLNITTDGNAVTIEFVE